MAKAYDDKKIGKEAEAKLTASLRAKTSSFADHFNGSNDKKSLKDAKAVSRYQKYGTKKGGTLQFYLRSIALVMEPHGFIRHFGVDANRASGFRLRKNPKETRYSFRGHYMKQKPEPFIDHVIISSKVREFVAEKIAESRGEEFAETIAVSLSRFDK